jgi:glycosyltransferase involved in cell wall biosynthesis
MSNKIIKFIRNFYDCYIIFKHASYDKNYYIQNYPTLKKYASNKYLSHPVIHYVLHGVYDRYDLQSDFDSKFYLDNNLDVQGNPYVHYLKTGRREGRAPSCVFTSVADLPRLQLGLSVADDVLWLLQEHGYVLVLDHGLGGGAGEYLEKKLLPKFKKKKSVAVFTPDKSNGAEGGVLRVLMKDGKKVQVSVESIFLIMTYVADEIIVNNLSGYNHKQFNAVMHYLSIYEGKIEILFHDFYSLCPSVVLMEKDVYCQLAECDNCSVIKKEKLKLWRSDWQKLFDKANRITFFSKSSKEIAEKIFKFSDKFVVQPHKPLISFKKSDKYQYSDSNSLTVGFIGAVNKVKGADIILKMAVDNPNVSFVVIGYVVNAYESQIAKQKNIKVTGAYNQKQLPALLKEHNITVAAITSVVPETFCYVLQELMLLEYPIVSFDIGAQGERISTYKYGAVVDVLNSESMFLKIKQLSQSFGELYE